MTALQRRGNDRLNVIDAVVYTEDEKMPWLGGWQGDRGMFVGDEKCLPSKNAKK
jgi:hypothetical protein